MVLLRRITLLLVKKYHKRVVGIFGPDWINGGNTKMGLKIQAVKPISSSCLFPFGVSISLFARYH